MLSAEIKAVLESIFKQYIDDPEPYLQIRISKFADYQVCIISLAKRLGRNIKELTQEIQEQVDKAFEEGKL